MAWCDGAAIAMRTAATGRPLLQHAHAGAAPKQVKRTGQADHTTTKDYNIATGSIHPTIVAILSDWYLRTDKERRRLDSRNHDIVPTMPMRLSKCLFCTTVLLALPSVHAQAPAPETSVPTTDQVIKHFGAAPNGLARYDYLNEVIPRLDKDDAAFARQLLATVDSELGLYDEALMTFPFDNRINPSRSAMLPQRGAWATVSAADAVVDMAANRHIVMVNEAHHDAHTRELTLELLPRLRAMGFQYFAAEAVDDKDPGLMQRGYAIDTTGSEYLLEPLYGEIIRQAIKLGYIIVPYDADASASTARDTIEAQTLYEKVFAKDPQAKLFVHAGYSHIDKASGNLGSGIKPMGMQLAQMSGYDPLCVDQVQFRDVAVGGLDFGFYDKVALQFSPHEPIALRKLDSDTYWTSDRREHDITVILPPAAPSDLDYGVANVADAVRREITLPQAPFDPRERPSWLSLEGKRTTVSIDTTLCQDQVPCVVDAYYTGEPDNATPADRYTFLKGHSHNVLYLYPGHYRLRAWNAAGATLGQENIDVAMH